MEESSIQNCERDTVSIPIPYTDKTKDLRNIFETGFQVDKDVYNRIMDFLSVRMDGFL